MIRNLLLLALCAIAIPVFALSPKEKPMSLHELTDVVTNFGQPPAMLADQQDADDTADPTKANATVAMEFSRVETSR